MTIGKAERELKEFDAVFGALSHEARRRILVVLLGRGGKMTAGKIVERFKCSWPTMTRHFRVLVDADLIRVEKQGRERTYILNKTHLLHVTKNWTHWFEEENNVET